jgi:hypothetical protein
MARYPRLILQFVAATGFAVMLSAAAPVVAAESAVTISQASAKAKTAASTTRHASRLRLAAWHYNRHVNLIRSDLGCSGVWCGRQFVLMVGVGY